jgi:hypothetical protein
MLMNGKMLRHELKYYIHPQEYHVLRHRLRPFLGLDRHSVNGEGYHIRSLYFDNMHETALHDKINGVFQRKKYRIRIYNVSDQSINLERKSKWNEYVLKESAELTRDEVELLLEGEIDWLRDKNQRLLQEFYQDMRSGAMRPSVIVDYIREAYMDTLSNTRITFDKHLSAGFHSFALFDPELITWEAIEGPRLIMEVKFNRFLPGTIQSLIQAYANQRSTISKYVLCKERQKVYVF